MPHHQLAGAGRPESAAQRRRSGGTQAQDHLARRLHALGDEPAGVPSAAGGAGSATEAAPDPVPRGVAPNAKLRSLVVPQGPPAHEEPASEAAAAAKCEVKAAEAPVQRISWPRLLKPVFDIDMQRCPNCSAGELKIIAAILDQWGECSNPFARPRDSLKAFKERFLKAFSIGNGRCADRD